MTPTIWAACAVYAAGAILTNRLMGGLPLWRPGLRLYFVASILALVLWPAVLTVAACLWITDRDK